MPTIGANKITVPNATGTAHIDIQDGDLLLLAGSSGIVGNGLTAASTSGIVAKAGGGQTNAVQLTGLWNLVATCATAGDSVKLPPAQSGVTVIVNNQGAANLAVFPFLGGAINGGAANASITVPAGNELELHASDATNWYCESGGSVDAGGNNAFTGTNSFAKMTGFGIAAPAYEIDVLGGGLHVGALTTPGAPATVTNTGVAGATTYWYWVVAIDIAGNATVPTTALSTTTANATLDGTNFNVITWAATPAAASYKILRTPTNVTPTTGGATLVGSTTALTINDQSNTTSAYTVASTNQTGKAVIDGALSVGDTIVVNKVAEPGVAEVLQKWTVSDDATGILTLQNGTGSAGTFYPRFNGSSAAANPGLYFFASSVTDSGTNALMIFTSRIGAVAAQVRPLFDWQNNSVSMLQLIPTNAGANAYLSWGTQSVAAPTFTTQSAGSRLVLRSAITGSTVDYGFGVEASNLWLATSSAGSGIKFYGGTTLYAQLIAGNWLQTQVAATTGSPTGVSFTGAAHTTLTASTEATDVNINLARTVQFASVPPTTQRAVRIQAPTYSCDTAAQTITTAVTLEISGAPAAGANVTITNPIALRVAAGQTNLDGSARIGGASGTPLTQVTVYSQGITPASVGALTSAEQTFTVTGLAVTDKVVVNAPAQTAGTGIVNVRASNTNTVAITFMNTTATPQTPTAGTHLFIATRS